LQNRWLFLSSSQHTRVGEPRKPVPSASLQTGENGSF
jgi:hypothetical protein